MKVLGPLFTMFIDVLRVGFGMLMTMIGLALLISFFFAGGVMLGLFSIGSSPLFWWDMHVSGLGLPMEAIRNTFPLWTMLMAFLLSIIPAIFISLLGVSVIVKRIIFKPIVGWTLFVLFFICIAVLSFKIPQTIYSFREEGSFIEEVSYPIEGKTLVFNVREVGLEDYDVTELRIIGHDVDDIRIVKRYEAQGASRKIAADNAQMVTYQVSKNDSIYTFDSNLAFKKDVPFRAQRVKVDVYVPYDHPFVIDQYLWDMIENYGRHNYRDSQQRRSTWIMTTSGMVCTSCEEYTSPKKIGSSLDFSDFESIELTGIFNVNIDEGDDYAVEIEGSSRQKELYDVFTQHKTLVIDYDNENEIFFWKNELFEDDKITINITMPHLRELDIKGAGKIRFNNFEESDVEIKLSGAVVADGRLRATTLDIEINGASFLDLEGSGNFMEADITGASALRAYQYEVDRAVIGAHGASSAKVYVNETLEINKSFASAVSHKGNATVINNR